MAHMDQAYGDLAERRKKGCDTVHVLIVQMDGKYDPALEASLATWMSGVIGEKVSGPFKDTLKNGAILCKYASFICYYLQTPSVPWSPRRLINKLQPGAVPSVYSGEMAFKQVFRACMRELNGMQMENIGKFLGACPPFGVRSDELFQSPDLFEGSNMTAVFVR